MLTVRAPEAPRAPGGRGARVFHLRAAMVRAIDLSLEGRRLMAERRQDGWEIDGRPGTPATEQALDDLVASLVELRSVDLFRPRDEATFGLDAPRAIVALHVRRRTRRLVIGSPNAAGSAYYARRDGDPRILVVGAALLSEIGRVFYQRDLGSRS
jgi:hypothetical protein